MGRLLDSLAKKRYEEEDEKEEIKKGKLKATNKPPRKLPASSNDEDASPFKANGYDHIIRPM